MIHQMPTVMVEIRSRDSWWQKNGEAVYCNHEHASSCASCAIRAHVHEFARLIWPTSLI
jgi:hypothetical protein